MIIGFAAALCSLAAAHDVSPAVFVPSTSPGDPEVDVMVGAGAHLLDAHSTGGTMATVSVRLGRAAFGATGSVGPDSQLGGRGWLGVALVDRDVLRVQVFGEAGELLRPGISVVGRTRRGGVGGHGLQLDLAWGPAWSLDRLTTPTWGGAFDLLGSMPEGGIAMSLHPNGTQFLRAGFVGSIPVASYRLDTRGKRRHGFLLESTLGTNFVGHVATLSIGWNGF